MSQGEYSLVYFDGTHLYDTGKVNLDNHPELNVASFDYSKPQVRSFLMSNIRYWIEEYHVDGLKFSETASMLYLDYGRNRENGFRIFMVEKKILMRLNLSRM